MIITHTANANGERRVYLGGRSSVECWIEPAAGGWRLQIQPAYCGNPLSSEQRDMCARQMLATLAETLSVAPDQLPGVSFESIASCHTLDPYAAQRGPVTRRLRDKDSFLALAPSLRQRQ